MSGGITERWSVPGAGSQHLVTVYFTYRTPRGSRADTLSALLLCK